MKLLIMILIYTATEALALFLLYGPLRAASDPQRKYPQRTIIPLIILGTLFLFPLIGALVPDGPVCWFFQKWGNIFIGYIIYFFSMLLIASLFLLVRRIVCKLRNAGRPEWTQRNASVLLGVLAAATIIINISGSVAAHDVKTTFYELPKAQLGLEEPMRIVLIGDLHMGVNSSPKLFEDMVMRINEQDPDLVLVAGDIVTSSYGAMRDPDAYSSVLSGIQARLGKYAVYGNHDVDEPLLGGFTYVGAENAHRNPHMDQFMSDCGWTLLRDEVTEIEGLDGIVLAGRRDESRPGDGVRERASLAQLTSEAGDPDHIILLQHEPSDLGELDNYGIDMSLSGHTHDGQIFPGNIYSRIKGPQSYGLKKWGSADVLVTSGVGYYGPPIRVGTISEIVVIDLK